MNPVIFLAFSLQTVSGPWYREREPNRTLHFDELRRQRLEFRWAEALEFVKQSIGKEGVMLRKSTRNLPMGPLESLVE